MAARREKVTNDYSGIVAVRDARGELKTEMLFDGAHEDSSTSPVDLFVENTTRLNRLWAAKSEDDYLDSELGVLLVLGYVSAVESYMRALIRRVVDVDPYARASCEPHVLTFAAAVHQRPSMLAEALLEETIFSGEKGIKDGLRKFVGFELNDAKVLTLLRRYGHVCEVRHCCVHRFGKLGTKNAVQLGLEKHKGLLEKPLRMKVKDIAAIADLLFTVVKSINNEVFRFLLERSARPIAKLEGAQTTWAWHWGKDRKRYLSYYEIFSTTQDESPSPEPRELYDRFRDVFHRRK